MKCAGFRALISYSSMSFISGATEKWGGDEVQTGITSEPKAHDHAHGPDCS